MISLLGRACLKRVEVRIRRTMLEFHGDGEKFQFFSPLCPEKTAGPEKEQCSTHPHHIHDHTTGTLHTTDSGLLGRVVKVTESGGCGCRGVRLSHNIQELRDLMLGFIAIGFTAT